MVTIAAVPAAGAGDRSAGEAPGPAWDAPAGPAPFTVDILGGARVTISHPGPLSVALAASGEIDLLTVRALSDCLLAAVQTPGCRQLLVDLGEVGFLGATGVAAFAQAHARAGECGVTVRLVTASSIARRTLELTGALDPTGAAACFDSTPPMRGTRDDNVITTHHRG